MLRALTVAVLIIGLLALAVLGPKWLMSSSSSEQVDAAGCDLFEQPCSWSGGENHWQAKLTRLEAGAQGDQLKLLVQTSARPERLTAILKGHSMYLGEYPVPMQRGSEPGRWQAVFTAPFCTIEPTMAWRIELRQGQNPLNGVPFNLVFNASGTG